VKERWRLGGVSPANRQIAIWSWTACVVDTNEYFRFCRFGGEDAAEPAGGDASVPAGACSDI
jgi:hypothetical protein